MTYNGRNLKTGSDFYSAAMDLMGKGGETNRKVFAGALILFLEGAERSDRFCIQRLKEILTSPNYLRMGLFPVIRESRLEPLADVG